MSAESKEKAREHGMKSGKGAQLLSRVLGRINGESTDRDESSDE